jgi:iron-sulfur cluster assembly protein/iron-sulfur cluster insertion protein
VITLTDTAAVKVKELLQAEGADDMALRVAVRPGGCKIGRAHV